MIFTAAAGAAVVTSTTFDTLVTPFDASKVRQSEGVLRDVGPGAVSTNAAVGQ